MASAAQNRQIDYEDRLRAEFYDFLGALLAGPPDAGLLEKTARLAGDDGPLGRAVQALSRAAAMTAADAVEAEYNVLFIGLGRGELLPYGSYYLTGFLNEKPLASLRDDMRELGIRRAAKVSEPEDHIASLMEMMAGMIAGRFGEPVDAGRIQAFFETHVSPWAGHFFTDLENAGNAVFYAPVGSAGRAFMDIETEAFRLSGPRPATAARVAHAT